MKNIILLTVLSTLIQGCTSIAQPTASLPLVEHEFVFPSASIDVSLSTALSNAKAGSEMIIQQKPTVMGERFFAATGLTCRKLTSEQTGQHIYCLNIQGSWFQVENVISEYNESDIPRASL
ncbi:hypothetical protein [Paraglaciecola sp. MB-3u-78]|uniref:hypothetical protein n=1 Tax=Paraglaciecola sp. MB-3u-78 TaxID=2058332 RepID=UPI000C33BECA|nr:hypothetical protein [Paraglaciecola sp. MB-3u-78]PKG98937.1 hypothetical protein CXF95_13985 [Paraglaciecola sp. MB-3u-78]